MTPQRKKIPEKTERKNNTQVSKTPKDCLPEFFLWQNYFEVARIWMLQSAT